MWTYVGVAFLWALSIIAIVYFVHKAKTNRPPDEAPDWIMAPLAEDPNAVDTECPRCGMSWNRTANPKGTHNCGVEGYDL